MFKKSMKTLVIVVIALTLAGFSYAFAEANTFPTPPHAGDGSTTISGYAVTNIAFTLDSATPTNITAVTFTLDGVAGTVKASLNSGSLVSCSNTSGNNWSCPVTSTVTAASSLRVLAYD